MNPHCATYFEVYIEVMVTRASTALGWLRLGPPRGMPSKSHVTEPVNIPDALETRDFDGTFTVLFFLGSYDSQTNPIRQRQRHANS